MKTAYMNSPLSIPQADIDHCAPHDLDASALIEVASPPIAFVGAGEIEGVMPPSKPAGRSRAGLVAAREACDRFEKELLSGQAVVPAHPTRPKSIWYNKLARDLDIARAMLDHPDIRQRIFGWMHRFGLVLPKQKPVTALTLREFSKAMLAVRQRELGSVPADKAKAQCANRRWAITKVIERFGGQADAKTSIEAALGLAVDERWPGGKKLLQELKSCHEYLTESDGLPDDVASLLQCAMDRLGLTDASVAKNVGISRGAVWKWRIGARQPTLYSYENTRKLEKFLGLPSGSILVCALHKQRGVRNAPVDLYPSELRGREKAYLRNKVLALMSPEDFCSDEEKRHARIRECLAYLEANQTTIGKALKRIRKNHYRLTAKQWKTPGLAQEWQSFGDFHTLELLPRRWKRVGRRWRPATIEMTRTFFSALFGAWVCDRNTKFSMNLEDVGFGYLVFPKLFHLRLELAQEWCCAMDLPVELPRYDVSKLPELRTMLNPITGWITQSPDLANRLKPISGYNGEVIISAAEIEAVREDWPSACARARAEYAALGRSLRSIDQRRRRSHEPVMAILEMENPLVAFKMLCEGVAAEKLAPGTLAHACQQRDQVILGILTQCGFRRHTMGWLDLEHLRYDEKAKRWSMRVPSTLYKNKDGPYFKSPNGEEREYFERELMDRYGLYSAIEKYLSWGRGFILEDLKTDALFASVRRKARRVSGMVWEPGRFIDPSMTRLVERMTAKHLSYKPGTGRGIKGVVRFGPHAFRHILATAVLKLASDGNAEQQAADAIQDSVATVRQNYARYVPRDREKKLVETLNQAFV